MTELDQIAERPEREFTGKHMLIVMVSFFGVIIAVNFSMAVLASKTWTGLVVQNSYVASQEFNGHLEAARLQKELGWQGGLAYESGSIVFSLSDKNGKSVNLDAVYVEIGRPAFEQQDQTINLAKIGPGKYRGEVALGSGPWAFSLRGKQGEQYYRLDTRVDVSAAEAGK